MKRSPSPLINSQNHIQARSPINNDIDLLMELLPELQNSILSDFGLALPDFINASQTNTKWHALIQDYFRKKVEMYFPYVTNAPQDRVAFHVSRILAEPDSDSSADNADDSIEMDDDSIEMNDVSSEMDDASNERIPPPAQVNFGYGDPVNWIKAFAKEIAFYKRRYPHFEIDDILRALKGDKALIIELLREDCPYDKTEMLAIMYANGHPLPEQLDENTKRNIKRFALDLMAANGRTREIAELFQNSPEIFDDYWNATGFEFEDLWIYALSRGHINLAESLNTMGMAMGLRNFNKMRFYVMALKKAIENVNEAGIAYLVANYSVNNELNSAFEDAFAEAVASGNLSVVRLLAYCTEWKARGLVKAIEKGNQEILEFLLKGDQLSPEDIHTAILLIIHSTAIHDKTMIGRLLTASAPTADFGEYLRACVLINDSQTFDLLVQYAGWSDADLMGVLSDLLSFAANNSNVNLDLTEFLQTRIEFLKNKMMMDSIMPEERWVDDFGMGPIGFYNMYADGALINTPAETMPQNPTPENLSEEEDWMELDEDNTPRQR